MNENLILEENNPAILEILKEYGVSVKEVGEYKEMGDIPKRTVEGILVENIPIETVRKDSQWLLEKYLKRGSIQHGICQLKIRKDLVDIKYSTDGSPTRDLFGYTVYLKMGRVWGGDKVNAFMSIERKDEIYTAISLHDLEFNPMKV